jgi:hypothetical protein
MKTRKNTRENFTYSLLLGIEEAKERGDFDSLKEPMNCSPAEDVEPEVIFEYCSKVGL